VKDVRELKLEKNV